MSKPQKGAKKAAKTTRNKLPAFWDLSPLFKGENDPAIAVKLEQTKKLHLAFINKWKNNKNRLTNSKVLAEALADLNDLSKAGGLTHGYGYFLSLSSSTDENSKSLKAKMGQLKDFALPIENELEFFTNELSKVPIEMQNRFLKAPELKSYQHMLAKLFEVGKHILTPAEERILNLKEAPAGSYWVRMTSNLLANTLSPALTEDGKKTNANMAELISLLSSTKKKVRDTAAKSLNELMAKYAPIAEHEMNAILDNKKVNDELRGFTRPDQSRHISDDIESSVVDAMTTAVSDLNSIAHQFYQLKAKLLKTKKLEYHERSVPIGELKAKFDYESGVALVNKVLTNLDPEFGEIFMGFVKNKQIDVYPKMNKTSGAYCAGELPQFPTYILMNYTDKLDSVLTLAHEVGHGINNELMKKVQPAHYFETPLSTAEVASTFMEDFVLEELSQNVNDRDRLTLYMTKLHSDISTIFRQVACYRFEQQLHHLFRERGYLSKEDIGAIFAIHMRSYMGPAINYYAGTENWWVYWGHIRHFFYNYSYASGLLISKALQAKVRADKNFIKDVKYFLSAGSSDSPRNIFKKIGIDISDEQFWTTGLLEIKNDLTKATALAKKLKLI